MVRGDEPFHHHFILLKFASKFPMLAVQFYRLWGKVGKSVFLQALITSSATFGHLL